MSDDSRRQLPYKQLGTRLKTLREKCRESLAEVSGAIEIDIQTLERFERGLARPAEEILFLLVSHFDLADEEASKLWDLAGYEKQDLPFTNDGGPAVIMVPANIRIEYTDMVHAQANEAGVVLSFMQSAGPQGQPMIVSRVGMSREHARHVLASIEQVLNSNELQQKTPKSLPAPRHNSDHKE